MKLFAVKDLRADCFLKPFFALHLPEAMRSLTAVVEDPQSLFCKFPSDFALYQFGDFDQADGDLVLLDGPVHVCILDSLVAGKKVENG